MTGMLYFYAGDVVRIVDGDTLWIDIDLGFRQRMRASCRLHGVNAPERGTPGADAATEYLRGRLIGKHVIVSSRNLDKYGRPVVTIYDPPEAERSVNEEMLELGLVVAYMADR